MSVILVPGGGTGRGQSKAVRWADGSPGGQPFLCVGAGADGDRPVNHQFTQAQRQGAYAFQPVDETHAVYAESVLFAAGVGAQPGGWQRCAARRKGR